jgi:hypothetical protein
MNNSEPNFKEMLLTLLGYLVVAILIGFVVRLILPAAIPIKKSTSCIDGVLHTVIATPLDTHDNMPKGCE